MACFLLLQLIQGCLGCFLGPFYLFSFRCSKTLQFTALASLRFTISNGNSYKHEHSFAITGQMSDYETLTNACLVAQVATSGTTISGRQMKKCCERNRRAKRAEKGLGGGGGGGMKRRGSLPTKLLAFLPSLSLHIFPISHPLPPFRSILHRRPC